MSNIIPDASFYEEEAIMKRNFTIFHPFHNRADDNNDISAGFVKWGDGCAQHGLTNNLSDFHIGILHYYFGLARFGDTYRITTKEYYYSNIDPIYQKLKTMPKDILPLDEKLDFFLFNQIIEATGQNTFITAGAFDPDLPEKMDLATLRQAYEKYLSLEVMTLDKNFYIKSIPDEVVTVVGFNDNDNVMKILERLGKYMDIVEIHKD